MVPEVNEPTASGCSDQPDAKSSHKWKHIDQTSVPRIDAQRFAALGKRQPTTAANRKYTEEGSQLGTDTYQPLNA